MHIIELDLKEAIVEDDIDKFVFSSIKRIVIKDLDVFVKVGTADHPAKIDSMVRLSEELVNTKSLRVRWVVNKKKRWLIYHPSGRCTLLRGIPEGEYL